MWNFQRRACCCTGGKQLTGAAGLKRVGLREGSRQKVRWPPLIQGRPARVAYSMAAADSQMLSGAVVWCPLSVGCCMLPSSVACVWTVGMLTVVSVSCLRAVACAVVCRLPLMFAVGLKPTNRLNHHRGSRAGLSVTTWIPVAADSCGCNQLDIPRGSSQFVGTCPPKLLHFSRRTSRRLLRLPSCSPFFKLKNLVPLKHAIVHASTQFCCHQRTLHWGGHAGLFGVPCSLSL